MAWPEFTSLVNPLATHMLGESVAVEIQASEQSRPIDNVDDENGANELK
jgi:hypothetical protein